MNFQYSKIFDFFPKGVVCLDLETTGLSPLVNRIVEIAGIKVTPTGLEKFSSLVNPGIKMDSKNISIHHITNEMVKDAPPISEVLPRFMDFCGGLPFVAHNAQFDLGFIVYSLHALGMPFSDNGIYCTVKLSRLVFKELERFKLGILAEKLNIELKNAHRAEDDAFVCLKIFHQGLLRATKKDVEQSLIFHLNDFQKFENFKLEGHLKLIQEKIDSQEIMRIRYLGGTRKNEFRPIRPISLLPLPQGNVLYAHCLESDLYKIYNLKKIVECRNASEEDLIKYSKKDEF